MRGPRPAAPGFGLARILSKRGICSRSVAAQWIAAGRVRVDGRIVRDPEQRTAHDARIEVGADVEHPHTRAAGQAAAPQALRVLLLNKPRGLVSTRTDEQGRATVYQCLTDPGLPWLAPVGRLDQASEGMLLFATRPDFAEAINHPDRHVPKTYHVQIDRLPDAALLDRLRAGISDRGEALAATSVEVLRQGQRHCWLTITLTEGRNRQIRRMLAQCGSDVLRLVRVAIGGLPLGALGKGQWRWLADAEIALLLASPRSGGGDRG